MTCNLQSDPDCQAALQASQYAQSTPQAVAALVNSSSMASFFSTYQNNLQGFNGGFDSESGVSFNLAPFLKGLCKAYQLTGAQQWANEIGNRIDQLFAKNDQAVVAAGLQVPDANGNTGSIVPYQACAVPAGFNLNTPHCGWSRWAPSFLSSSCPAARARPEPLADGHIAYHIAAAIKCLKDCGGLDQSRADGWLDKLRQVIEVYDVWWLENHTPQHPSMGPLDGNDNSITFAGAYFDQFDKPLPLNQAAIMLAADLVYQQCRNDRTGAKARAARMMIDINSNYMTQAGGVDQGWYYTMWLNCTETYEDLAHSETTFEFLKAAVDCGVSGALATLTRMTQSLKANAYQGAGNWSWYNNGILSHGTLANTSSGGPWGAGNTVPGCSTTQSFSSGASGGEELHRGVILLTDLPEPLNTACKPERDASMMRWQSGDGFASSAGELMARLCYSTSLCTVEVAQPVSPCIVPPPTLTVPSSGATFTIAELSARSDCTFLDANWTDTGGGGGSVVVTPSTIMAIPGDGTTGGRLDIRFSCNGQIFDCSGPAGAYPLTVSKEDCKTATVCVTGSPLPPAPTCNAQPIGIVREDGDGPICRYPTTLCLRALTHQPVVWKQVKGPPLSFTANANPLKVVIPHRAPGGYSFQPTIRQS